MSAHNEIGWEDVEDAAAKIFNVWYIGSELEWAKEVWDHLGKAGLNQASGVLERTKVSLRLVTLGRIYHEFCGCAWDENPDWPIGDFAEDLEIDPVALGLVAAEKGVDQSDYWLDDESDLRESALIKASDAMRREIFDCLKQAYGNEIQLYSRMRQTHQPELRDSDDLEHDFEEFEVTGNNMYALNYVQQGFHR